MFYNRSLDPFDYCRQIDENEMANKNLVIDARNDVVRMVECVFSSN